MNSKNIKLRPNYTTNLTTSSVFSKYAKAIFKDANI